MKYFMCGLLLVLFACGGEQKVTTFPEEAEGVYTLCKSAPLPKEIAMQVQLDTLAEGQLQLRALIRNTSASELLLNPYQTSLLTEDERRQSPVSVSPEEEKLQAGEEREYRWLFQPINDLYLYQRSGLHGSLKQVYRLPLSFIQGVEGSLSFCFPEEAYLDYSKKAAGRAPVLYAPSDKTLFPQTAARQEQYWAELNGALEDGQAGSAYFSEQEFFSAGVNVRHALYHRGDSLYLRLHLVNHAPYTLRVDPAAVQVSVPGSKDPAQELQPASLHKEAPYTVRKGDRLTLNLRYPVAAADSLLISLQGIEVEELKKPLFLESFTYVRQ